MNSKRFDAYEVRRVFEKDGICQPVDSEEEAKYYRKSGHDEYWTLYGHRDGEGVEAIADRKTEEEVHELLFAITGLTGEHGRDVYEVTHEDLNNRELAAVLHGLLS